MEITLYTLNLTLVFTTKILLYFLKKKYKVKIKKPQIKQNTEAAPDTEEAEEKDPGLFSQAQGLVICIKQIKF